MNTKNIQPNLTGKRNYFEVEMSYEFVQCKFVQFLEKKKRVSICNVAILYEFVLFLEKSKHL